MRFYLNSKLQLSNHYSKRPALIPNKWKSIAQPRIFHFYQISKKTLSRCSPWMIWLQPSYTQISINAYLAGHSTEIALLRIVSDILTASDANQVSIPTLLDLETPLHYSPLHAVEPSWRTVCCLWSGLQLGQVTPVKQVSICLQSSSNSKLSKLNYGVPQGSMLGPILFVLYTQPLSQIPSNHSCPHRFFADDTQLRKSCSPEHYNDVRNALQTCIPDIKRWMTENKLNLTEARQKQCCPFSQNS